MYDPCCFPGMYQSCSSGHMEDAHPCEVLGPPLPFPSRSLKIFDRLNVRPTKTNTPIKQYRQYVGKPTFTSDRLYEEGAPPGVVMGLAWTAMGGSSLYVEAMAIKPPPDHLTENASLEVSGKGSDSVSASSGARLRTTGQLGDVMNESAQVRGMMHED